MEDNFSKNIFLLKSEMRLSTDILRYHVNISEITLKHAVKRYPGEIHKHIYISKILEKHFQHSDFK